MKKFGIRKVLAHDHPRRHLLGDDWEAFEWFDSEQIRDRAYRASQREHRYSRRGDVPRLVLECVEQ